MHNTRNMTIAKHLRDILVAPAARGLDLNSDEATRVHTAMIRTKPFLKKLYSHYYGEFARAAKLSPPGLSLEIGAGGGFLEEWVPSVVTFDIRPGAQVDCVASALGLPLKSASVSTIFMLNVLHHLPDVRLFFEEAVRVLIPGGRIMFIEPYVSPFSKRVYQHLHHEPFIPDAPTWELEFSSAMTSANGALPWIVFVRDRTQFESEFSQLEIARVEPHTASLYLLSGGVSMRAMVPGQLFEPLLFAEKTLGPLMRHFATMMTVEIVRR